MKQINIIEFCSGIGAISHAFKRKGVNLNILGFADLDNTANKAFKVLHPSAGRELGNILDIDKEWWRKQDIDILSYGFPCQDISGLGNEKGMSKDSGTRSALAWNILDLIKENLPQILIIENVHNILTKNHFSAFKSYLQEIELLGYQIEYKTLKGTDVNIPQTRRRVFVIASKIGKFEFAIPKTVEVNLETIIESNVEDDFYYLKEDRSFIQKYKNKKEFNKVLATKINSKHSWAIPRSYSCGGVLGVQY